MGAVATRLAMDRTTLTAALKPLERGGVVASGLSPTDKRKRILTLTPAGLELLARAVPIWRAIQGEVDNLLRPAHDGAQLRHTLRFIGEFGPAVEEYTSGSPRSAP